MLYPVLTISTSRLVQECGGPLTLCLDQSIFQFLYKLHGHVHVHVHLPVHVYKNKFKNLIRTSKFKFSFQGLCTPKNLNQTIHVHPTVGQL